VGTAFQDIPGKQPKPSMQVLSVNVGGIRETAWKGKTFNTAIFKEAVVGRVKVAPLGLIGDEHANAENHGGSLKALFAYPYEHYTEFWHDSLPGTPLPHGCFGENLTTQNWLEHHVHVGDRYRIGTAVVMVTIPRKPCYKLNARLSRDDVLPKYLESKRTGFYLAVVEGGDMGAGDVIELLDGHRLHVTPRDIVDLYLGHSLDRELLERALKLEFVTDRMRKILAERFEHFARHSEEESEEF
jgi:MOSC domain-containing protein YiiM